MFLPRKFSHQNIRLRHGLRKFCSDHCLRFGHTLLRTETRFPFKRNRLRCVTRGMRALRKRNSQETQMLALASSQSWLPLLRPSIHPCMACVCCVKFTRLRFLRFSFTQRKRLRLNGNWDLDDIMVKTDD